VVHAFSEFCGVQELNSTLRRGRIIASWSLVFVALLSLGACSPLAFASCDERNEAAMVAVESVWPQGVEISHAEGGACSQSGDYFIVYAKGDLSREDSEALAQRLGELGWQEEDTDANPKERAWTMEKDGHTFSASIHVYRDGDLFKILLVD